MTDPEAAIAMLTGLRHVGVRLSVDDFGTGYSSLSYLKRLPVDEVKLDKSFVFNMTSDANDAAIVRSMPADSLVLLLRSPEPIMVGRRD